MANHYSFEKAREEASLIENNLRDGKAKDYKEAEKLVDKQQYERIRQLREKDSTLYQQLLKTLDEKYKLGETTNEVPIILALDRVALAWGSLENVKGKRILDIGCGARSETFETDEFNKLDVKEGKAPSRSFEPWFCRALHELGADTVGIDIGNLKGEEFEHYEVNITKPGALNFLPDKSFDGINLHLVLSSPELGLWTTSSGDERAKQNIADELKKQMKRLLKDDGKELTVEFDKY